MYKGMEPAELLTELRRQKGASLDYGANVASLAMQMQTRREPAPPPLTPEQEQRVAESNGDVLDSIMERVRIPSEEEIAAAVGKQPEAENMIPMLTVEGIGAFPVKSIAHRQLATHFHIPFPYYQRMLENKPLLLCDNINTWMQDEPKTKRMVRTLDGEVRAFMSDKYRRIDNYPLAIAVLQTVLQEMDVGAKVHSCDITDSHMYIKIVSEKLKGEVRPHMHSSYDGPESADIVQAGIVIKNSEVGQSSVVVEPMIVRLVCWNGAVMEQAIRRRHVGRGNMGDQDVEELLSDATKKKDDAAFFAKVKDVVKGSLKEDVFNLNLEMMKDSTKREMTQPVKPTVELLAGNYRLTDKESDAVLEALIRDNDNTQWGLGNAVTLMSQSASSYDRASELESVGGDLLMQDDKQWEAFMKQVERSAS